MIPLENRLNPQASRLSPEPLTAGLDCWGLSWSGRWHRLVHPAEVLATYREVKSMDRTAPSDWEAVEFYADGQPRKRFTFGRRSFASREAGGTPVPCLAGGAVFEGLAGWDHVPGFTRPKATPAAPTATADRMDSRSWAPAPPAPRRLRR